METTGSGMIWNGIKFELRITCIKEITRKKKITNCKKRTKQSLKYFIGCCDS